MGLNSAKLGDGVENRVEQGRHTAKSTGRSSRLTASTPRRGLGKLARTSPGIMLLACYEPPTFTPNEALVVRIA